MAEYVKWRLTKMRAGVTMALFGVLAGLGLRTDEGPAAPIDRAASLTIPKGTHIPTNSIGSAQVKMHSLLLSDMKEHQVASYASLVKLSQKWSDLNARLAKFDTELGSFELKTDAVNTFLGKEDTAVNAAKIENVGLDGLVQGHGQVITGNLVPTQSPAPLMSIPGMLTVNGSHDPAANPSIIVVNISGNDLEVNDGSGQQTTLKAGESLPAVQMADGSTKTFQILISGGGTATTLTISGFADGSVHRLVGQALVGSP
jgi:hypothetical protein